MCGQGKRPIGGYGHASGVSCRGKEEAVTPGGGRGGLGEGGVVALGLASVRLTILGRTTSVAKFSQSRCLEGLLLRGRVGRRVRIITSVGSLEGLVDRCKGIKSGLGRVTGRFGDNKDRSHTMRGRVRRYVASLFRLEGRMLGLTNNVGNGHGARWGRGYGLLNYCRLSSI